MIEHKKRPCLRCDIMIPYDKHVRLCAQCHRNIEYRQYTQAKKDRRTYIEDFGIFGKVKIK